MKHKRWVLPTVALPIIGLLWFGLTRDATKVPTALLGKPAPDFSLPTLTGDTLRLADHRGQVVLVNFWASWCLACHEEHPLIVAADRRWRNDGLRVIGVVYQDTRDNASDWIREYGGEWPNVMDLGSQTAINYGLFAVPETFFIDRQGRIVHKQFGPLTKAILDELIPRLLADSVAEIVRTSSRGI